MDEFEFISWVKSRAEKLYEGSPHIHTGIDDDLAVVKSLADGYILIGSDMITDKVHFDISKDDPMKVGRKAIGVALSDCAAMAANPIGCVISIAIPERISIDTIKKIYNGMFEVSKEFSCPIIGGDTVRSDNDLTIDVCIVGKADRPIFRSGAKVGDWIYITGKLGGSILGKQFEFTPRIRESQWLVENIPVNSMIDISDGLISDLNHICTQSGCGAVLEYSHLEAVISEDAYRLSESTGKSPLEHAFSDGEDYELLFTASVLPEDLPFTCDDITLFPIGVVVETLGLHLKLEGGLLKELYPSGYKHF